MYLVADYLRQRGLLDETEVHFFSPGGVIFGIEKFAKTLREVVKRYGIRLNFKHNLIEVRGPGHEAVFEVTNEEGEVSYHTVPFDMIHVTPPMSAPDFIKYSALADGNGWVDVDPYTLQHRQFPNVFSLGDVAGTPNAKTGAAVRKQAPVVTHNLLELRNKGVLRKPASYNGYSSCPLVTGYGRLVLAEFDYDKNPAPSFPFDTSKERRSMYLLKKNGLPWMYWNLMLKGKA
jgi:sulfide:quinone oxidoreductase